MIIFDSIVKNYPWLQIPEMENASDNPKKEEGNAIIMMKI